MLKPLLLAGSATLALGTASAQIHQQPLTASSPMVGTGSDAAWGDLDPFWGDLDPFWGDLEGFWGDIEPFWGDLEGFWGDLEGFGGDTSGTWGDLEGFYGDLEGFWGDLEGFWDPTSQVVWSDAALDDVVSRFRLMTADADAIFGETVRTRHGASFDTALLDPLLARYGVAPDLTGLKDLAPNARARLFLDFYDALMDHSGRDRVDWWMGAVGWSPALAQDHAVRRQASVGVLDSTIAGSAQASTRLRYRGGYRNIQLDGRAHGAAVSSLIAAPHDGIGIMGVAPTARLLNYNPFDDTSTAGWGDITRGIGSLRRRGAHVVNASLGVEDRVVSSEWATVLGSTLLGADDVAVVKAAGNSGVQGQDSFWWDASANDALIVVGSVNVAGEISAFSNRPGDACFVTWSGCEDGDRLQDRFLVAPGELVLVDDGTGTGGTLRASGTSFAAPLVSGTIALMHNRWPWLENHAAATTDIVLSSARDLGAPGTDAVYGRGLLDIEAALSPLDFDDLYQVRGRGQGARRVALGDALLSEGGLRGFARSGVLVAFEDTGDTFRDFAIPLSDRTVGGRTRAAGDRRVATQSHLFGRLADWSSDQSALIHAGAGTLHGRGYALSFTQSQGSDGRIIGESVYRFDSGATLTLGSGAGLPTSLLFDNEADAGGARLSGTAGLLGFAQGGSYAGGTVPWGDATLSFAVTRTDQDTPLLGFDPDPTFAQTGEDAYGALGGAFALSRPLLGARVSLGYQRLAEANGVLGTQGSGALSLGRGATSDAVTADVVFPAAFGITTGFSATTARTRAGEQTGLLRVGDAGLVSTAFAARLAATNVLFAADALRLSVSQPLTAIGGDLYYEGLAITDRATGQRAFAATRLDASAAPMVAEASYRVGVFSERASLRALVGHDTASRESQVGMSLGVAF